MKSLIIFPHQLFHEIPNEYSITLVEHPIFYDRFKFNKKKILLHKASCLAYVDAHKVHHVPYERYDKWKYPDEFYIYDPTDYGLEKELQQYNVHYLDTPAFLWTHTQLIEFFNRGKKPHHAAFYKASIELHKIPYIKKSYDTENRNAIPKDVDIPDIKHYNNKYVRKAIKWTNKLFPDNYGNTENIYFPTTRKEAMGLLNTFINQRLEVFGTYQDAIVPEESYLFHSLLSSSLNIGLITPREVVDEVMRHHDYVDIANLEGFIRQIVGWREYQRYIYMFYEPVIRNSNHFNHHRKLSSKWYNGTLGIPPVDDAITRAWDTGYLHHIERLMVIANFMNLVEIEPNEAYRWFMEFAIDSYDWVMIGNVYSMGLWADGGLTMRKPYISTANYIQKMSGNRWEHGEWEDTWRNLYYRFIDKHPKIPYKKGKYETVDIGKY
jgi:deoxyribodipyrimidine photolyase-related protein